MGTYDTYGDKGIQIKAGGCMMHHHNIGDTCDLEDGIYLGYVGAIVIIDKVFIAEFPHIFTKYGGQIDCHALIDQYNPCVQAVNDLIKNK